MSEVARWGQSTGLLPFGQSNKLERARDAVTDEAAFMGHVIDAQAALAGRSMERTTDLYHYARNLAAGDQDLQGALMGEVGGFIGRSAATQRRFGSQFG